MQRRGRLSIMNLTTRDRDGDDRRVPGRVRCERLKTSTGRVVDISRTGAKLIVRAMRAPVQGERRTLTFEDALDESAAFASTVIWVRRTAFMQYEIGIRFDELDERSTRQLSEIVRVYCKRSIIADAA